MKNLNTISLLKYINENLVSYYDELTVSVEDITLEVSLSKLYSLLSMLKNNENTKFEQLIDLCGVDYLYYGLSDWETQSASETGFCRGVSQHSQQINKHNGKRFAVVYHLLSVTYNHRIRVKVFVDDQEPVPSVHNIWSVANWFEREAYDLFGLLFTGHPDLRRILTDYGFIGFPFRKDFPLSGHVEMKYDEDLKKVIYEPVSIEPRTLVPKVIREDNRYTEANLEDKNA